MSEQFEVHAPASSGAKGMPGWQVVLRPLGADSRRFSFDERDDCYTAADAVQTAFDRIADLVVDGADIQVTVSEIRIVVSAEIHPN